MCAGAPGGGRGTARGLGRRLWQRVGRLAGRVCRVDGASHCLETRTALAFRRTFPLFHERFTVESRLPRRRAGYVDYLAAVPQCQREPLLSPVHHPPMTRL